MNRQIDTFICWARSLTAAFTIDLIARLGPWLAPLPSAYFVARASLAHLAVPTWIAVVIAAAIEILGVSTVTTVLRLYDWNQTSLTPAGNLRKGRILAPTRFINLAAATVAIYLTVTITLTVLLEVHPRLATVAPAIFPVLAIVGAVNLAIRSNQNRRELSGQNRSNMRSNTRSGARSGAGQTSPPKRAEEPRLLKPADQLLPAPDPNLAQLDRANAVRRLNRDQALTALVDYYLANPTASHRQAAREIGRSKSWVTGTLGELEQAGRVRRNGYGVEIIER